MPPINDGGIEPISRLGISRRRVLGSLAWMMCSPWSRGLPALLLRSGLATAPSKDQSDPIIPQQYQSGGNTRYTTEVGGFFKAIQLFKRFHQPGDELNLRLNCERREQALATEFAFLRDYLNKVLPTTPYKDVVRSHETWAQFSSYKGEMHQAIDHFQSAYDLAVSHQLPAGDILRLKESLGIAELRRGESENCLAGHMAMSCIFPLHSSAQHMAPSGSERATEHFKEYLKAAPNDIEVQWLLNIAAMTLGKYPQQVPPEHLLSPDLFKSEQDIGRFADIAPALGLNMLRMAGGVIVDDFDNDGFLDVVTSTFDACAPLRYLHNNGDGTFSDWTEKAGLSDQLGGLNIVQVDYNNDGLLDIFVMRGAWELPIRNSLLRNNGDGTFTDVTHAAGLAEPAFQTLSAAWADFDNDGYLDLFIGHEDRPHQLFHNNGNGTFTDVSKHAGVDKVGIAKGVTVGDYDNDGYPDIYVSTLGSDNLLFHNNGNGTFTEVGRELGVAAPNWSFPTWFFDYDNDGSLDLFVSNYSFSLTDVLNSWLRRPLQADTARLYKNLGNGTFRDVTKEAGLDRVLMSMGSNFGDLDNDGFLDIYLGTGGPSYATLIPNLLFKNEKGKRFIDITASSGTGHLQKGHAVAFADINNDGDQEIIAEIGGATPGDRYFSAVFKNPSQHGNQWITVKLVGVKSNRSAIGARIKVTVREAGSEPRHIYRWVNSGGSFGSSPLQQHIGVGKAQTIETLEVWWPTTKTRQLFYQLPMNRFIEIKEFEKTYTTLKHKTFPLPSSA
jgi:FG-GAP-like repeat/ASPIC and UnbV